MNVVWINETLRSWRRRPGATLATIASLLVAIALFAAIASVLQAFLFRPSLVRDIDRVVRVRERVDNAADQAVFSLSPRVFDAWRAGQTVFDDMAAATTQNVAMQGADGTSDALPAALVTANFFHVLGIAPQLGRDFAAGEDRSGRATVALLSDATWRQRFNADPAILGRALRIDGRSYTVVGVMPPHLSHPYGAALWLPMRWDEVVRQPGGNYLYAPARLRNGVGIGAAQSSLSTLAATLHRGHPEFGPTNAASLSPLRAESLRDLAPTLWLLFAGACFVVFVAVLNTATMFYAQSLAGARATAVRIALGAGRRALFRRALVRSGALVATATAGALLVASQLVTPLFALSGNASIREFDSVARLDLPTLCWIAGAAAIIVVVLAWFEVRRSFDGLPAGGLGVRDASAGPGLRKRLAAATIAQCALAFVLAAAALLVTLGYRHLRTMDRGYAPDALVLADLTIPLARYPDTAARNALVGRLLDGLRNTPGVEAAAGSTVTPDFEGDWSGRFVVPGRAPLPAPGYELANHRLVTPGYFATLGMTLLAGRDFDRVSPERDTHAVIVSQQFAAHAWPGGSAIGKTVGRVDGNAHVVADLSVIGVVGNVVEAVRDPLAPAQRTWYLSTTAGTDYDFAAITVAVRSSMPPLQVAGAMRRTLAQVDDELAWANLATMRSRLARSVGREQLGSLLFTLFAASSLLIAFAGVYAALAFLVETSRREFGIRLALGALTRQIARRIVLQALGLVVLGLAAGALLALPALHLVASYVHGVRVSDAWALVPLGLALVGPALVAGCAAAWRAAATDPIEALRHE